VPEIPRQHVIAYAIAGVLILLLGARELGHANASTPAHAAHGGGGGATAAVSAPATVAIGSAGGSALVDVAGAVRRPGVYRLREGDRVQDAVRRAGGATRRAELDAINLAAKVLDGQQIVVPQRGSAAGVAAGQAAGSTGDATPAGPPISLNSATAEQLDTLDGVGPATAQKILQWRQAHGGFRSVDDLGQVPGIGPKKLAALRGRVQP
jgi:competence protein ComEA